MKSKQRPLRTKLEKARDASYERGMIDGLRMWETVIQSTPGVGPKTQDKLHKRMKELASQMAGGGQTCISQTNGREFNTW